MNDFEISRADSQTICKEIGDRLHYSFLAGSLPASLRMLMDELAKADRLTHQIRQ